MPIGSRLGERRDKVTICYYGKEGRGKTTDGLRATLIDEPGRVLLIDAEAGAKVQALRDRGVDVDLIDTWPETPAGMTFDSFESMLTDLRAELREDPTAYKAVVVDSFSEIARRFIDEIAEAAREEAARKGKARGRFQVDLADHGTNSQMMRWMLRQLRDLGTHLVVTALERRDQDDDGLVSYGPAVGPAVASDLAGLVDLVCFCDLEEIGDTTWRIGSFRPQVRRRAKDRFGVLPPKMIDPYFDRVVDYVYGNLTRDTDERRAAFLAALDSASSAAPPAPPAPAADSGDNKPSEAAPAADGPDDAREEVPNSDGADETPTGTDGDSRELETAGGSATRPARRR